MARQRHAFCVLVPSCATRADLPRPWARIPGRPAVPVRLTSSQVGNRNEGKKTKDAQYASVISPDSTAQSCARLAPPGYLGRASPFRDGPPAAFRNARAGHLRTNCSRGGAQGRQGAKGGPPAGVCRRGRRCARRRHAARPRVHAAPCRALHPCACRIRCALNPCASATPARCLNWVHHHDSRRCINLCGARPTRHLARLVALCFAMR